MVFQVIEPKRRKGHDAKEEKSKKFKDIPHFKGAIDREKKMKEYEKSRKREQEEESKLKE